MKSSYENFIGVYDDAVPAEACQAIISYFEWCQENNRTYARPNPETFKKDDSTNLNPIWTQEISFVWENCRGFINEFNQAFWDQCYKEYREKYSALDQYEGHTIYTYKVQKTEPSGGYHVWHCEDGGINFSHRMGVYILYLNDVLDGGETEFLYFSKRVSPKQGRLIIFPPNFPWTHRGNPPLTGNKYIMTGWIEFR